MASLVMLSACGSLMDPQGGETDPTSAPSSTTGGTAGTSTGGTSTATIQSEGTSTGTTTAGTTPVVSGTTSGGTSTGTATGTTPGGTSTAGTTTSGGNACTPDGWVNFAQKIFGFDCAGCHSTEFSTLVQVMSNATNIESKVKTNAMPPSGATTALDANDRARLVKWFDCGTPN